jgi:predicted RNA-binding protein with PIN domain
MQTHRPTSRASAQRAGATGSQPPTSGTSNGLKPTVLVDARNVLRSQWPNIPERELVELCRAWSAAEDVHSVVVFDGAAPGNVVGERELDDRCLLVGTGEETADEWIERRARELAAARRSYWLVTSDRALRAAAGAGAQRTIGGGTFARRLLADGQPSRGS